MISPLVRRIVGISVLLGVTAACLPYLTSGRSPSETANNLGISISQTTDKRKTFADRSTVRLQGQRGKAGDALPEAPDQEQIDVREPDGKKASADDGEKGRKAAVTPEGDPDEPVMPSDEELRTIQKQQAEEEKAKQARRQAEAARKAEAEKKAAADARARKEADERKAAEARKLAERQKAARQSVEEKKAAEKRAAEEKKASERERIAAARKAAEEKRAAEKKAAEERSKTAAASAAEERKKAQPAKAAAEQKAFASRLNAVKYRDSLRSNGYPNARMEPITRDGRVLFRVVPGESN